MRLSRYLFIDIVTASSEEVHLTPESSPELTKRSWFGSLLLADKEETVTALVKGKPLATVKADLIHAFLSVSIMSDICDNIVYNYRY